LAFSREKGPFLIGPILRLFIDTFPFCYSFVNAFVANANSLLGVCVHLQEGEKETEVKPVVSNDVELDDQNQAVEESIIQQATHSPTKVS